MRNRADAIVTETPDTPSLTILVHEGQDGWLFLLTGSNFVASLYEREGDNLPDRALLRWRDITAARARRCAALGIRCLFVVVPDKLTIYDHKTATPLVDPALAPAVRLREQIEAAGQSADYLDLVSPMRAARDEQALYWRTDSHWSPEGCFLAYRAICKKLDLVADETLLTRPFIDEHRVMDLGGWVEPHKAETIRAYRYLQRSTPDCHEPHHTLSGRPTLRGTVPHGSPLLVHEPTRAKSAARSAHRRFLQWPGCEIPDGHARGNGSFPAIRLERLGRLAGRTMGPSRHRDLRDRRAVLVGRTGRRDQLDPARMETGVSCPPNPPRASQGFAQSDHLIRRRFARS